MAHSSATQWDIRTTATASNVNGGGFVTGASGTDYSQQDTAQYDLSGLTSAGAGDTVLSASAAADMVGNYINVASGTNFTTGPFQIVSVSVGVSFTCATNNSSASITTGVGAAGAGKIGGALIDGSAVATTAWAVAGNTIHQKSGTYSRTTAWSITVKGTIAAGRIRWHGFGTTHGDWGTKPDNTSASSGVAIFAPNDADYFEFRNLTFTHTHATRGNALNFVTSTSSPVWVIDCLIDGCLQVGNSTGGTVYMIGVEIKSCTSATAAVVCGIGNHFFGCSIHDNTGDGIRGTGGGTTVITVDYCLIYLNGGNAIDAVDTNQSLVLQITNSVLCDNGAAAVLLGSNVQTTTLLIYNNIIYSNTGYGINDAETQIEVDAAARLIRNNAFGDNSSGAYTGVDASWGEITLTADPFIDKATGDFRLNNTAGGGALLRRAGWPNSWPGNTPSVGYRDVGPVQHLDPPAARNLIIQSIGTY